MARANGEAKTLPSDGFMALGLRDACGGGTGAGAVGCGDDTGLEGVGAASGFPGAGGAASVST